MNIGNGRPSDDLAWHRSRKIRRAVLDKVTAFADENFGDEQMHDAWCDFHCARGCRPMDWNSEEMPMFLSWYHFVWRPPTGEDKKGRELLGPSVAEAWLDRDHSKLSEAETLYAATCARSAFSFWRIDKVEAGEGVWATDLFTDARALIYDKDFAEGLEPGKILFAMAVTVDGVTTFEACAPVVFQPNHVAAIEALRAELKAELRRITIDDLQDNTLELVDLYQEFRTGGLRPVPPQCSN